MSLGIYRLCVLFHYSEVFISSGGCPSRPVLGFGSKFLTWLLCLQHLLKWFLGSFSFLQSYVMSLGPIYSTFAARNKAKKESPDNVIS